MKFKNVKVMLNGVEIKGIKEVEYKESKSRPFNIEFPFDIEYMNNSIHYANATGQTIEITPVEVLKLRNKAIFKKLEQNGFKTPFESDDFDSEFDKRCGFFLNDDNNFELYLNNKKIAEILRIPEITRIGRKPTDYNFNFFK